MFDSQLLRGETVDLDVSDLWRHAVTMARIAKTMARESNTRVAALRADHQFDLANVVWAGYCQHFGEWSACSLILRSAIADRTRQEREQAAAVVGIGGAAWMVPACASDECDDCERPVWMHIRLDIGYTLCPFGREFWTYARAIDSQGVGVTRDDVRARCSIIAIRTARRGGAKRR